MKFVKPSFVLALLSLVIIGCGNSRFGGSSKDASKNSSSGKNGLAAGEDGADKGQSGNGDGTGNGGGDGSNGEVITDGDGVTRGTGFGGDGTRILGEGDVTSIAVKGKSLDLYAIFDVSGSLKGNDQKCLRFEAFNGFLGKLKMFLGDKTDVRLSIVTFSTQVGDVVTLQNLLAGDLAALSQNINKIVCAANGDTNPNAAFEKVLSLKKELELQSKKETKSVLFFTDGFPSLKPGFPSLNTILSSSEKVNEAFNSKMFGVMLGANNSNVTPCNLLSPGCQFTPESFIQTVVKNKSNFRNVQNSTELSDALLSFIK